MTFLDFIIFLLDVILGHTPLMIVLLHTKRSDFAFIWIRCSDFICITFACTTVRPSTSFSAYQAFRFRLHMDKMFKLHLHHMC